MSSYLSESDGVFIEPVIQHFLSKDQVKLDKGYKVIESYVDNVRFGGGEFS